MDRYGADSDGIGGKIKPARNRVRMRAGLRILRAVSGRFAQGELEGYHAVMSDALRSVERSSGLASDIVLAIWITQIDLREDFREFLTYVSFDRLHPICFPLLFRFNPSDLRIDCGSLAVQLLQIPICW